MRALCCFVILAAVAISPALAADQTWVGKISDSDCGAKHKPATEHEAAMSDADCTAACIKAGAKYVFVNDGKVLNISNQSFPGLSKHAGHEVKLTGELTDDSIQVTKIEMPKKG
jgi:hypothetical protein